MRRFIAKLRCLCSAIALISLLSQEVQGQSNNILLSWLLHTDQHIVDDHAAIIRDLNRTAEFGISAERSVDIPPNVVDPRAAFSEGLDRALARLAEGGGDQLFLLLDSHGLKDFVCHNQNLFPLAELTNILFSRIRAFEGRHRPIKVNLIYNACFSGSLRPHLEAAQRTHAPRSRMTAIMASAPNRLANSTFLRTELAQTPGRIATLGESFCPGCTAFERFAKVIAALPLGDKNLPNAWGTSPQLQEWTFADAARLIGIQADGVWPWHQQDLPRLSSDSLRAALRNPEQHVDPLSREIFLAAPFTGITENAFLAELARMNDDPAKWERLRAFLLDPEKSPTLKGIFWSWFTRPEAPAGAREMLAGLERSGWPANLEQRHFWRIRSWRLIQQFENARRANDDLRVVAALADAHDIPVGAAHSASPLSATKVQVNDLFANYLEFARSDEARTREFLQRFLASPHAANRSVLLRLLNSIPLESNPELLDRMILAGLLPDIYDVNPFIRDRLVNRLGELPQSAFDLPRYRQEAIDYLLHPGRGLRGDRLVAAQRLQAAPAAGCFEPYAALARGRRPAANF